jgi:hypothetical protein
MLDSVPGTLFIRVECVKDTVVKLPNLRGAFVPPRKITHYLLDTSHDEGRGKALFFLHVGFDIAHWEELAEALVNHAQEHEVEKEETTRFGTRYIIEGALPTPAGRYVQLRSVWFISQGNPDPQFVTAYPLEEQYD